MRQELLLAPLQDPIALGSIVARGSGERYLNLLEQQREVALAGVDAEPFVKDVKVDDAAGQGVLRRQRRRRSRRPSRSEVRVRAARRRTRWLAQVAVDPAEVRTQYDENARQYTQAEERKAAHILIAVKPDAKDDEKAAAKKKAEDLLAQAKANPAKFAELAKAELAGSRARPPQGGDLGSFPRGTMVKPFDDAVFAMKPGEIAGPVQSEFGYHVIRLDGVTPAQVASVRRGEGADRGRPQAAEGRAEVRRGGRPVPEPRLRAGRLAAGRRRRRSASTVQTSPLVTRAQAQAIAQGNAKFVQALFSPESIAGQAQHRGDRGRAQRADGGPHRRAQAGGAAAARRGGRRDPPPAGAQGRRRAGAEGRPREARAARAGQERRRKPASCSASR